MAAGAINIAVLARSAEERIAEAALFIMAVLPVVELILRIFFNTGIAGSTSYVQHLTLWVGFLGAIVAARSKQHLTFIPTLAFLPPAWQRKAAVFSASVSATVALGLALASVQFVYSQIDAPTRVAGWLPIWVLQLILPLCFTIIAFRCVIDAGAWTARAVAALSSAAAIAIPLVLSAHAPNMLWPGFIALTLAALCGAPIFVVLAGAPLLLFFADGSPIASIPVETYRLVVSPTIPTIPLFALTGYILAEGGASRRLLRLLSALFGWLPGGLPIVAVLLCAFFTTFTGASGVTILALGGLLLPV
ncbi:MAG: TRAP transporter small permease subunit, partial [Candidatus Binatia bacterium]